MSFGLGFWANTAGGGAAAGAYEQIATAFGTGSSGVITFASIPSTYKHLQIRWAARETTASTNLQWQLRFNSDSASNYNDHIILGDGGGVFSGYSGSSSYIGFSYQAGSPTSGLYTSCIIDILDYAATSKNKTTRGFVNGLSGAGNTRLALTSGLWRQTAAVSSLTITAQTSNFDTASRFSLYGSRG